jgi:hypothetical protein
MAEVSDELWDEVYDRTTDAIYAAFSVYFEGHPAKHTILGEGAEAVRDIIIDILERENDGPSS